MLELDQSYEIIIRLIPAWAVAFVAILNAIAFVLRDRSGVVYISKHFLLIRAISMSLWGLFYVLIGIDNHLNSIMLIPKHLAMVRLSFFWELNVNLLYNISALRYAKSLKGSVRND